MSYKKDDILVFMTNEPHSHVWEMFRHKTVIMEEIEKEPYCGFVKSVISAKEGIYLMITLKPLKGSVCIIENADIIRSVDKNELPEEERKSKSWEYTEAPNVYTPANNTDYSMLTEQEHCIALAKEAMQHLFPEISITEFNFDDDWYSRSQFVSDMDDIDAYRERIKDSTIKAMFLRMKEEILKHISSARFKEYYTVNVGTSTADGTCFIIVAVSKEFDEVSVLRNVKDRSDFFRSLGPEFVDVTYALNYYRERVVGQVYSFNNLTQINESTNH